MGWNKRALVEMAWKEIGVSPSLGYGITAEQVADGMNTLEAMMGTLYQSGYRLGYNSATEYNGGDPDSDSGIPHGANEAVYLSLAIRIASSIGKQLSPHTIAAHRAAMNALAMYSEMPTVKRDPDQSPAGQGNRRTRWPNDPFLDPNYPDALSANRPGDLGEYSQ